MPYVYDSLEFAKRFHNHHSIFTFLFISLDPHNSLVTTVTVILLYRWENRGTEKRRIATLPSKALSSAFQLKLTAQVYGAFSLWWAGLVLKSRLLNCIGRTRSPIPLVSHGVCTPSFIFFIYRPSPYCPTHTHDQVVLLVVTEKIQQVKMM